MTYHIRLKDYTCPKCEALYVPYEEGVACPCCSTKTEIGVSKEYSDFIDSIIISLRVNKMREGRFRPSAWYMGTFVGYVQSIIFRVFDAWDKNWFDKGEIFINKQIDAINFGKDYPYIKDYIKSIASKVYKERKFLRISLFEKFLSKVLPSIMP